jgi:F420-non-reducing hydrogenase iron-sulfur subunit
VRSNRIDKLYPQVLVFACNWDGWSCVETATGLGLHYPDSVKVVRVSCLSRVHVGLILRAFEFGADGVMLLGCEQGRCHFGADSEYIADEYEKTQNILEMLGMWKDRLVLVQLPAFDGRGFVMRVMNLMAEIERRASAKQARVMSPGPAPELGDIYSVPHNLL